MLYLSFRKFVLHLQHIRTQNHNTQHDTWMTSDNTQTWYMDGRKDKYTPWYMSDDETNSQHNTKQSGLPVIISTCYAQKWDGSLFRSPILIGTNVLEALACNPGTWYRRPNGMRWYWLYNGWVMSLEIALPFLSTRVSYIEVILSSGTPAILLDTLMIVWNVLIYRR